jgi:23S rRNA pseudouridine1911/1915/1917 synthase
MTTVLPVLYEDNHVLVVVKPPGLPSQADRTRDPDLLTRLKADLKERHGKPGAVFLGLVHRLDRPVGGVMVLAKTSKAASRLSQQIRERTFEKTYAARVHGTPVPAEGRLTHWLLKDRRRNVVQVVPAGTADAQQAELTYQVQSTRQGISIVRVQLITGRPHQIRVQMAAIGCPLVGDARYGRAAGDPSAGAIQLWSASLAFAHPTRGERLRFEAAPPW